MSLKNLDIYDFKYLAKPKEAAGLSLTITRSSGFQGWQ